MLAFAFGSFLRNACRSGNLAVYQAISVTAGSILIWEMWMLNMEYPASCGRWAKRGVQCKLFLCVAMTGAFVVPMVREMMMVGA